MIRDEVEDELDNEARLAAIRSMSEGGDSLATAGRQAQPEPEAIRAMYSPAVATERQPLPMPEKQAQADTEGRAMNVQLPSTQQAAPSAPASRGDWDFFRAATAFGGGDVNAYDAAQKERRNRPYVQEQRRLQASDDAQARADRERASASARARLDPLSPESKQAQDDYVNALNQYANIPGIPKSISDQLVESSANASKMSAAHIDRAFPALKDLLGTALKGASVVQNNENKDEDRNLKRMSTTAQIESAKAARDLANLRFTESKQEKAAARDEKEAEAYGKDISPLNEKLALLEGVSANKKSVDTGPVMAKLQKVRQWFGIEDKDWDTLEGRLSAVDNEIIKAQAGGNVTAGEAERMRQQLPSMDMNDATFNAKLLTVAEQLRLKKQQVNLKHPRTAQQKTFNDVTPPKESTGAEGLDPEKAAKAVRARAALSDPNASEKAKAGAKAWLQANGF